MQTCLRLVKRYLGQLLQIIIRGLSSLVVKSEPKTSVKSFNLVPGFEPRTSRVSEDQDGSLQMSQTEGDQPVLL